MKSREQIAGELARLEAANYYSEDFEWLSAVRAYRDGLSHEELAELRSVVLQRLLAEGSMTDILLCSLVEAPSAAPVPAAKLDRESVPSQLTRALITALQGYRGDDVFRAVARFVDSDQENEALRALARIDFARALPFIARALQKKHQRDLVLHILHDRAKQVGVASLLMELRAFSAGWNDPGLPALIRLALAGKAEPYNPFTPDALKQLMDGLAGSR